MRKQAETALQQVTRKLTLLNQVTFNDIHNAVFTLNGYLSRSKKSFLMAKWSTITMIWRWNLSGRLSIH